MNKKSAIIGTLLLVAIFVLAELSCIEENKTPTAEESASIFEKPFSGNVPLSVDVTGGSGEPVNFRPFFDVFSWEMFIALNWPAVEGQRGVPQDPDDPDTFLQASNTAPVVWTSYKNQFDLFGQGKYRPTPWNAFQNDSTLCASGNDVQFVLGSAKGNTLNEGDIDEAFSFPLIDQAKNYALFEMRYNQSMYNFIRGNDANESSWLYLRKNLVNALINSKDSLVMPASQGTTKTEGAIMVKAAWKVLTSKDVDSLYYVVNEEIYDPVTKTCTTQKVGLVGLHLVQKIDSFTQWIWSSFEHRNNAPGVGSQKPYTFNNGTDIPATQGGWARRPDSLGINPDTTRVPTQVTRYNEIPTTPADSSTVDINEIYRNRLKGTVWENYQLVITQWPTDFTKFTIYGNPGGIYPQAAGAPFPMEGCTNIAAETYFQSANDAAGKGGNSCMSCHYQASATDFSWSLQLNAHAGN